ncbi:DUF4142 domain-containing protein [Myxococcus stipitatus]|uniref:DUF4142 domain-containing protein n=1 Tax=Myxococcus stipitatus TaxID=83455 RepID=UPI0030D2386B
MARKIRGGGVAALAAALVFGAMTGPARAEDPSKKTRKEQKEIGEAAAERTLYVGKLALFDAKQIALGNMALEKSQNPEVRAFAQKLVDDRRQHVSDLKTWADAKSIEVANIDLSQPGTATGGAGRTDESSAPPAMREGYNEKMKGVDERLDKAITEAEKDLDKLREKNGKDFDKAFLSHVADGSKKGQSLVKEGQQTYRSDGAFSALLSQTRQGIEREETQAKALEKHVR